MDSDQLTSGKPFDQNPHCFHNRVYPGMLKVPLILFPIIRARLYISSELSEDSHKTSSIDLFV